ncbi:lytic transglycosylase domain-containing protein [Aquimarina agarivorans]|uniref:lytic transglycosylase domain-containing protein n=1 Tax=Aquimarina agarivorans TaxID=980584 RepID=UPI000248EA54|nr:lytic transglycosylase domain-containing protein [Aquimarina agarivorans]
MNLIQRVLSLTGVVAISGILVFASQYPKNDTDKNRNLNDYNVYALDMPRNLNFANEPVPLEQPDVFERMDRELLVNTYWQSNGLLLIKRSKKYFPIIEPILKHYGVPNDFKYLAVIESGLTQAVSPAGAKGFWQILAGTGRELGLEVNKNVDERYHIEKATEAACKYLLKSKERLGSWTLAAAGYNGGNNGIQRRMKEQKVTDYYDLLLGQETGRYVFRIIALKEILCNTDKYGFNFSDKHLYKLPETYEVSVDTPVTNFADFAIKFNMTYKELKQENPWLRERHLNNKSRKEYTIKLLKR